MRYVTRDGEKVFELKDGDEVVEEEHVFVKQFGGHLRVVEVNKDCIVVEYHDTYEKAIYHGEYVVIEKKNLNSFSDVFIRKPSKEEFRERVSEIIMSDENVDNGAEDDADAIYDWLEGGDHED